MMRLAFLTRLDELLRRPCIHASIIMMSAQKTRSMDRLHRESNYENQLKSGLFKELFLFQTCLEQFNNEHLGHREKIQDLIVSIDELMEELLIE